MKKDLQEVLKPYLPENSLEFIMSWIDGRSVFIRITRGRRSKLGDYRSPQKDDVHRISVNGDLNPYEFLITLTHEIAHMLIWEKYGRKVKPHGTAWKHQYAGMLSILTGGSIFPQHIESIISKQVTNPGASNKSNIELTRALQSHNPAQSDVFLEDLPTGTIFSLPNGRTFRKEEKLRKWYRCTRQDNKRIYRISPVARVIPADLSG